VLLLFDLLIRDGNDWRNGQRTGGYLPRLRVMARSTVFATVGDIHTTTIYSTMTKTVNINALYATGSCAGAPDF
jgi:hypothetical protein